MNFDAIDKLVITYMETFRMVHFGSPFISGMTASFSPYLKAFGLRSMSAGFNHSNIAKIHVLVSYMAVVNLPRSKSLKRKNVLNVGIDPVLSKEP